MSAARGTTRRLQVLFLLALGGVLAVVGLTVASLAGPLVAVGYGVVVLALLAAGGRRARAALAPAGRTCTCCASSVHDPVRVRR